MVGKGTAFAQRDLRRDDDSSEVTANTIRLTTSKNSLLISTVTGPISGRLGHTLVTADFTGSRLILLRRGDDDLLQSRILLYSSLYRCSRTLDATRRFLGPPDVSIYSLFW